MIRNCMKFIELLNYFHYNIAFVKEAFHDVSLHFQTGSLSYDRDFIILGRENSNN